jgi:hypothetical protein
MANALDVAELRHSGAVQNFSCLFCAVQYIDFMRAVELRTVQANSQFRPQAGRKE